MTMPNRPRKGTLPSHDPSSRKQVVTLPTANADGGSKHSAATPKFNAIQLADILRPFWGHVLQNNIKKVKKFLRENRSKIDFNTARYTPCADGTALHICSQHGFISCAKLLLGIGVKIDLQNKRNNVAFDVAPYTLLDKRMLLPQREVLAVEHEEETRLLGIHRATIDHFEEVTLAKAHASMLLTDWESRAWEEWVVLQATNKMDREWSEQVQNSKDTLEIKRAMYLDQQVQLQKEQNQIALTWKNIFHDAQYRQQCAREEMEQMLMLAEETHQHWMQEQQELWDQRGLIDAADEFPNDEAVQYWVLCTVLAMIDEDESGCVPVNPHGKLVTTDINDLLLREEFILVIRNILLRFPAVRDLQFCALRCFIRLVRHCVKSSCSTRHHGLFCAALIKANVLTISRDSLFRFSEDFQIVHLVIELLYHLLRFQGQNGTHSLQFCHNILSHQLPVLVYRLHEVVLSSGYGPQIGSVHLNEDTILAVYHHTSFILFTLTKYDVRKALEKDGVVSLVRHLIFQLSNNSLIGDSCSKEIMTSTLRYLLGSLALLHSPQSSHRRISPRLNLQAPWLVEDLSRLLSSVRPWIALSALNCADNTFSSANRSLIFWTINLLRNLTQPVQDGIVQLRTWLRTREHFDLFAQVILAIRKANCYEDEDTAVLSIVIVWLEIVEDVWLCRYNSDGQPAAVATFILEFLLQLLELEAEAVQLNERGNAFTNYTAIIKLIALVLSNGKNMRYLIDHGYRIDIATHAILKNLLNYKQESHCNWVSTDATSHELIAHILRVYLRLFDYDNDHTKSGVDFHERCRAIGICTALYAFGLLNSEPLSTEPEVGRCQSPCANANQSDENASDPTHDSKMKMKMQLARAWSHSRVQEHSPHTSKRDTLCSLTRALLRYAPCRCFYN
ncbi:unnamed protein product [Phytophthora fragariaefolia]|uniref:Unnamed protein product n=1 Tax=Phytophthora fragariaefolia TaxID=1490495 RepID=A0A9W6Y1K4_9STRA|nr:unnamed protein product [Phytophthora fragariaefolia]